MNSTRNLAWPLILTFIIIMGWMPFEGIFWLVTSVGITLTVLWGWVAYQSPFLSSLGSTARLAAFGAMAGLAAPAVILGLMVLKTGVHAHGPEFTPPEIYWITQQFTIWPIFAGLCGLGVGFLNASRSPS